MRHPRNQTHRRQETQSQVSSPSQPTAARAPFNKPSADVILRSSDNVDFHVFKAVLLLASNVFESMLDLPQPTVPSVEDIHHHTHLLIVPVTENSQILDHLLRLCYPIVAPVLKDLRKIGLVLEAAIKYEMGDAKQQMKTRLLSFVDEEPLHVYAIACCLRLEIEATAAAVELLGYTTFEYIPQMDDISAGSLHRLLQYRRQPPLPSESISPSMFCEPSTGSSQGPPILRDMVTDHPFNFTSGDVILQSSDLVQFRVHSFILSQASVVFTRDLNSLALADSSGEEPDARVLVLPEDGLTVFNLLHFCYPMADPDTASLDVVHALLAAAVKYKLARAVAFARRDFLERTKTHPLQAYFIAMRYVLKERARKTGDGGEIEKGRAHDAARMWKTIAKAAADRAIYEARDEYTPGMEDVSAKVYRQFLEYRAACEQAIFTTMSSSQFPQHSFSIRPHWSDVGYDETNSGNLWILTWGVNASTTETDMPQIGDQIPTPVIEKALQETRDVYSRGYYGGAHNSSAWDVTRIIKDGKELRITLQAALAKVAFE